MPAFVVGFGMLWGMDDPYELMSREELLVELTKAHRALGAVRDEAAELVQDLRREREARRIFDEALREALRRAAAVATSGE